MEAAGRRYMVARAMAVAMGALVPVLVATCVRGRSLVVAVRRTASVVAMGRSSLMLMPAPVPVILPAPILAPASIPAPVPVVPYLLDQVDDDFAKGRGG